jgi:hypothetical protein
MAMSSNVCVLAKTGAWQRTFQITENSVDPEDIQAIAEEMQRPGPYIYVMTPEDTYLRNFAIEELVRGLRRKPLYKKCVKIGLNIMLIPHKGRAYVRAEYNRRPDFLLPLDLYDAFNCYGVKGIFSSGPPGIQEKYWRRLSYTYDGAIIYGKRVTMVVKGTVKDDTLHFTKHIKALSIHMSNYVGASLTLKGLNVDYLSFLCLRGHGEGGPPKLIFEDCTIKKIDLPTWADPTPFPRITGIPEGPLIAPHSAINHMTMHTAARLISGSAGILNYRSVSRNTDLVRNLGHLRLYADLKNALEARVPTEIALLILEFAGCSVDPAQRLTTASFSFLPSKDECLQALAGIAGYDSARNRVVGYQKRRRKWGYTRTHRKKVKR